jgi:hypothetical protein
MKHTTEMGSGAVMYILSFIKIGSGIQMLIGGYTDSLGISYAYFYFFRIRKV